jgi:predicted ATP-dependent Lon-type protease
MQMPTLNEKLNDIFAGYVVRKDLVKLVWGNAVVPSYVLEWIDVIVRTLNDGTITANAIAKAA